MAAITDVVYISEDTWDRMMFRAWLYSLVWQGPSCTIATAVTDVPPEVIKGARVVIIQDTPESDTALASARVVRSIIGEAAFTKIAVRGVDRSVIQHRYPPHVVDKILGSSQSSALKHTLKELLGIS